MLDTPLSPLCNFPSKSGEVLRQSVSDIPRSVQASDPPARTQQGLCKEAPEAAAPISRWLVSEQDLKERQPPWGPKFGTVPHPHTGPRARVWTWPGARGAHLLSERLAGEAAGKAVTDGTGQHVADPRPRSGFGAAPAPSAAKAAKAGDVGLAT